MFRNTFKDIPYFEGIFILEDIFTKLCFFVFLRASGLPVEQFCQGELRRAATFFAPFFLFSHAINIFFFSCRYVIKELVHDLAVHLSRYGCTWEVWEVVFVLDRYIHCFH